MRRYFGPILALLLAACATTPEVGWQARHAAGEALREAVRFAEEPLPDAWTDVPVTTVPVEINDPDLEGGTGALIYIGGFEIRSEFNRLHGLSDIRFVNSSDFVAISDEGLLVRGALRLDAQMRPTGLVDMAVRPLVDPDGAPLIPKFLADAEGLALTENRDLLVSFERDHRIWNYGSPDALAMRPAPVRRPDVDFPLNDGMEGVSARPGGWRVAGESDGVWDCSSTRCDFVVAPSETPLADSDFRITGMDRDPAGAGFFVVQRSYRRPIDVRANVRRLDENGVLGPILVALSLPGTTDNFEGIAAVTQGDATRLYILSDDNNNRHQRTLLLAFNVSR